jgi:hypothetical protein
VFSYENKTVFLESIVISKKIKRYVLIGLLQQLDETHYKNLWDEITACGDYKEMKDFLHRSLLVFKELLTQNWQVRTM